MPGIAGPPGPPSPAGPIGAERISFPGIAAGNTNVFPFSSFTPQTDVTCVVDLQVTIVLALNPAAPSTASAFPVWRANGGAWQGMSVTHGGQFAEPHPPTTPPGSVAAYIYAAPSLGMFHATAGQSVEIGCAAFADGGLAAVPGLCGAAWVCH